MCGRLLCDTKISAKEFIRARSYDLDSLCEQVIFKKNFIYITTRIVIYVGTYLFFLRKVEKFFQSHFQVAYLVILYST